MTRKHLLALILVSGYVVAFVPVVWARRDLSRIPRSIWRYTAPHPRQLWRGGLLVAYLCAGWPGLLVAVLWRVSTDRAALREEWAHLHRRNVQPRRATRDTASRAGPAPAPATEEREIVLADYEGAPEPDDDPAEIAKRRVSSHEDAPPTSG